jgi:hypothetical protein
MMLGFIYVVLTAKPISIRRLCLLYVVAWALARFLLSILRIEPAANLSVELATTIALLVWVSPPVRLLFCILRGRRVTLEVFETVSACVQFTYGFAFLVLPATAAKIWLAAPIALTQASLIPAIVMVCAGGLGLVIAIQAFNPPARAHCRRDRVERFTSI